MNRYILVEWPESQKFMENEDCIPGCDGEIWFVPEDIYIIKQMVLYILLVKQFKMKNYKIFYHNILKMQ